MGLFYLNNSLLRIEYRFQYSPYYTAVSSRHIDAKKTRKRKKNIQKLYQLRNTLIFSTIKNMLKYLRKILTLFVSVSLGLLRAYPKWHSVHSPVRGSVILHKMELQRVSEGE